MNNDLQKETNENKKSENCARRIYGAVIVKSKLANYNADFTGSPRTLPDGTAYATDKVLKFKIRDFFEKKGETIFVKTKYKENVNPMTSEEVYKYHFGEIDKDKLIILKNLLSAIDVRLFGVTFAPKVKKGNENINLSIHGPVQISYGVNRFLEFKDSGMFTDQIGSPFANQKVGEKEAAQTTLGAQTRSFEAHYVHHFSVNPDNLSHFAEQVLNEKKINDLVITKKENKKVILDKAEITKKINEIKDENLKKGVSDKLKSLEPQKVLEWTKFLRNNITADKNIADISLLTNDDINELKKAFQVAVSDYNSSSKKDTENELLMWIELNENNDVVLRNFTELTEITKGNGKTKINLENVFKYLEKYKGDIVKIEIFYDEDFTEVVGIPSDLKAGNNNPHLSEFKNLGKEEKTKNEKNNEN